MGLQLAYNVVWSVAVGLGVGDGTFLSVSNYVVQPVDGSPFAHVRQIATADLNGDGLSDVLALYGFEPGRVAVFTATNGGVLVRQTDVVAQRYCNSLAVADFNADGNPDFVVNGYLTNEVTIHFGDGRGAFPASVKVGTPVFAQCLAAADVNVDGRPDVLAGYYYNSGGSPVGILLNQPDGTFTTVTNIPIGITYPFDNFPSVITVADFNADGWPDFACGEDDGPGLTIVMQRAGIFTVFTNYVLSSSDVDQCAAADFNGDGITDLATEANLLVGKGNGEFIPSRPAQDDQVRGSLAVADVNRDGRPDILGSAGWFNCATNHTRPSLRIERAGNQARISWPAWEGFTFQTANSLNTEPGWTVVNDGVTQSNGRNVVVQPAESPAKYFRLKSD